MTAAVDWIGYGSGFPFLLPALSSDPDGSGLIRPTIPFSPVQMAKWFWRVKSFTFTALGYTPGYWRWTGSGPDPRGTSGTPDAIPDQSTDYTVGQIGVDPGSGIRPWVSFTREAQLETVDGNNIDWAYGYSMDPGESPGFVTYNQPRFGTLAGIDVVRIGPSSDTDTDLFWGSYYPDDPGRPDPVFSYDSATDTFTFYGEIRFDRSSVASGTSESTIEWTDAAGAGVVVATLDPPISGIDRAYYFKATLKPKVYWSYGGKYNTATGQLT